MVETQEAIKFSWGHVGKVTSLGLRGSTLSQPGTFLLITNLTLCFTASRNVRCERWILLSKPHGLQSLLVAFLAKMLSRVWVLVGCICGCSWGWVSKCWWRERREGLVTIGVCVCLYMYMHVFTCVWLLRSMGSAFVHAVHWTHLSPSHVKSLSSLVYVEVHFRAITAR